MAPTFHRRDSAGSTGPNGFRGTLFYHIPASLGTGMIDKAALRTLMHERRSELAADIRASAATALGAHAESLLSRTGALQAACVSSYSAIGPELDPAGLEAALVARHCTLCLPVMAGKTKPLIFRHYAHGDQLVERTWGIKEPPATAAVVTPDILLVPLLAFDDHGQRLGYGGGFYDRTLRALRAARRIQAVGLAYDEQRVLEVPHLDYDERLDWILTPSGLRRCTG